MSTYYRPRSELTVEEIRGTSGLKIIEETTSEDGKATRFFVETEDPESVYGVSGLWFDAYEGRVTDVARYGANNAETILERLPVDFASEYDEDYVEIASEYTTVKGLAIEAEDGGMVGLLFVR